jgi:hypothetical protein
MIVAPTRPRCSACPCASGTGRARACVYGVRVRACLSAQPAGTVIMVARRMQLCLWRAMQRPEETDLTVALRIPAKLNAAGTLRTDEKRFTPVP